MKITCHSKNKCKSFQIDEFDELMDSTGYTFQLDAKDAFLFDDPTTDDTHYFCTLECMASWLQSALVKEETPEKAATDCQPTYPTSNIGPSTDPLSTYLDSVYGHDFRYMAESAVDEATKYLGKRNLEIEDTILFDVAEKIMEARKKIYSKYKGEKDASSSEHTEKP